MHIFFILFTIHLIVNAFCRFCPFFFLWKVTGRVMKSQML